MNTAMKTGKDNFLMATLVLTGLVMAAVGPALTSPDAQAIVNSASGIVQSVSSPTALEPILYREAAIIVTAPRVRTTA